MNQGNITGRQLLVCLDFCTCVFSQQNTLHQDNVQLLGRSRMFLKYAAPCLKKIGALLGCYVQLQISITDLAYGLNWTYLGMSTDGKSTFQVFVRSLQLLGCMMSATPNYVKLLNTQYSLFMCYNFYAPSFIFYLSIGTLFLKCIIFLAFK